MTGPVLVTGAAGFAGRHLLQRLTPHGPVVAWHRPGDAPPATDGVRWAAVELLDGAAVARALDDAAPSAVYHLAGVPHVADSWARAADTLEGNVVGTWHLLDAMRTQGRTCRVVVTGSATVYQPSASALTEDDALAPNTPYGTSKLAQELVALTAFREFGLPVVVARSFNHIGPLQSPDFVASAFARQLALIEAGQLPPVLKVGNLEARRDLSDVRDTVRAYEALMGRGVAGRCYNVCSGAAISMQQLLDGLRAHIRVPVTVEQDPARMRPADTPLVLGDRGRLTADTGWTPEIPLETTLADLVEYWRSEARRTAS